MMDLQELKEAYFENLRHYNEAHPVRPILLKETLSKNSPQEKPEEGVLDEKTMVSILKTMKKKVKELEKQAKYSGNAQIWQRGEPLDGLRPGLRERVQKALEFGI